jgi:hypothetical protein
MLCRVWPRHREEQPRPRRTHTAAVDRPARGPGLTDIHLRFDPIVEASNHHDQNRGGDFIEAPWLVNGGHGASLRHHNDSDQNRGGD